MSSLKYKVLSSSFTGCLDTSSADKKKKKIKLANFIVWTVVQISLQSQGVQGTDVSLLSLKLYFKSPVYSNINRKQRSSLRGKVGLPYDKIWKVFLSIIPGLLKFRSIYLLILQFRAGSIKQCNFILQYRAGPFS